MVHEQKPGLFQEIYKVVRTIPKGKVMTYGQVARLVGTRDARKIGWALHANSDPQTPCHRVVTLEGKVSDNFAFGDYQEHKRRLLAEGVEFVSEKHVNLPKHSVVI